MSDPRCVLNNVYEAMYLCNVSHMSLWTYKKTNEYVRKLRISKYSPLILQLIYPELKSEYFGF